MRAGNAIIIRHLNARVVELADSLDSGSSAHSGRAGSSPASRTIKEARNRKVSGLFLLFLNVSRKVFAVVNFFLSFKRPISNTFLTPF